MSKRPLIEWEWPMWMLDTPWLWCLIVAFCVGVLTGVLFTFLFAYA